MPNVFVFTGHGDEDLTDYNARPSVPEGVTLVTFAECSRTTKGTDLTDVLLAMKEKDPELFEDPLKNQDALREAFGGRDFHVHPPGSPLPMLHYFSLAFQPISISGTPYVIAYSKSGVYKLPIDFPEQPGWKRNEEGTVLSRDDAPIRFKLPDYDHLVYARVGRYPGPNFTTAMHMYQGAVYPDNDTIFKHAMAATVDEQNDLWVPIQTVFKELGPGVYYWPICRGKTFTPAEEAKAAPIRAASAQKRRETHGKGRRKPRRHTKRKRRL